MTLPQLLKERSNELRTKFSELSNTEKEVLVTRHLQSKAERIDTPKKISNIAVSKAVSAKLDRVLNEVLSYFGHVPYILLSSL
jgi:hypothetical protein